MPSGEAFMPRQYCIGAWQATMLVIRYEPINRRTQPAELITQKSNYNQSGNMLRQCLDRHHIKYALAETKETLLLWNQKTYLPESIKLPSIPHTCN
jgi:hypothetical protein